MNNQKITYSVETVKAAETAAYMAATAAAMAGKSESEITTAANAAAQAVYAAAAEQAAAVKVKGLTESDINEKVARLKALEAQIKALETECETIKDALKADMTEKGVEELVTGAHIVRWKTFTQSRLDTTAFKKAQPAIYNAYLKQTTSRRFTAN